MVVSCQLVGPVAQKANIQAVKKLAPIMGPSDYSLSYILLTSHSCPAGALLLTFVNQMRGGQEDRVCLHLS